MNFRTIVLIFPLAALALAAAITPLGRMSAGAQEAGPMDRAQLVAPKIAALGDELSQRPMRFKHGRSPRVADVCGSSGTSCGGATPQCHLNAVLGWFCCGRNQVGCGSPSRSWCCASGTSCHGDGGCR
jgi:hypothetical protein